MNQIGLTTLSSVSMVHPLSARDIEQICRLLATSLASEKLDNVREAGLVLAYQDRVIMLATL